MSAKTLMLTSHTEQRTVIKHCVRVGMTPTDTYTFLRRDKSKPICSRALVFRWHKRFSDGHEDVDDLKRSGRPSVASERDINSVRDMLQDDRRRTVREIGDSVQLKRTVVHKIMREHLNLSKVSARWVPRLLSSEEKAARVTASNAFIRRYERDGQMFLNRIITTDETFISLIAVTRL